MDIRNEENKYNDIINMPHHVSKKYSQMSMEARAAQFAPFAALTGYGDEVKETARQTEKEIDIDEEIRYNINEKLKVIKENIKNRPNIKITYFILDNRKDGGKYITVTQKAKKIDEDNKYIMLENEEKIFFKYIIDIKL